MPTYDYVCETCGNRFEEWQKITDEPTKICPACGGPVHRVIYPVGLVFKGSGFYKTDNRSGSPAESGTTSATKETSGGDEKSAAKDAKSEATGKSADGAAMPASAASKSE